MGEGSATMSCFYCNGDKDTDSSEDLPNSDSSNWASVAPYEKELVIFSYSRELLTRFSINYCPMCGRRF